MRPIRSIVYRYLTDADFYNMYKPHGSEAGGGGQTYIDFPTGDVSIAEWKKFFSDVTGIHETSRAQGPVWNVPIGSIGLAQTKQMVGIYQRRLQSVSIANQTLDRPQTNRIDAWNPNHGFPQPADPTSRQQCPSGLVVFLVSTTDHTVWAGWFLNTASMPPSVHMDVRAHLADLLRARSMRKNRAGFIELSEPVVWLDETNPIQPFQPPPAAAPQSAHPSPDNHDSESAPTDLGSRTRENRARRQARATDGQGHQLDPKRRKAVEQYAMECAKVSYPGAEDTSLTESFDLRSYENGEEVHVEVKGTIGSGNFILVTANEIENALSYEWRTDLYVVSQIQLARQDDEYIASGGNTHIVRNWSPSMDDLTPTQYRYRIPE